MIPLPLPSAPERGETGWPSVLRHTNCRPAACRLPPIGTTMAISISQAPMPQRIPVNVQLGRTFIEGSRADGNRIDLDEQPVIALPRPHRRHGKNRNGDCSRYKTDTAGNRRNNTHRQLLSLFAGSIVRSRTEFPSTNRPATIIGSTCGSGFPINLPNKSAANSPTVAVSGTNAVIGTGS